MGKKPRSFSGDNEDMATEWPMTTSYTTEDGFLVKVFKAGHAVVTVNQYSVRPKKAYNVIGL